MGRPIPNDRLRAARRSRPSPMRPGRPLSRQELADACNQAMPPEHAIDVRGGRWVGVTAGYIGALERGDIRWPNAAYRAALRLVLGGSDHDLGFYIDRPERATTTPAVLEAGRGGTDGGDVPTDHLPAISGARGVPTIDRPGAGYPTAPAAAGLAGLAHVDANLRVVGEHSFLGVTRILASQRQAVAPQVLLSLVEAHRDSLTALLARAGTAPVAADIAVMVAETSIVASRLWSAVGERGIAVAHCAHARHLADRLAEAGPETLRADALALAATARLFEANLRSEAATLIGADGDIPHGLRLLEQAAAAGRVLPAPARARIAAEQAQTYAVLGLRAECLNALDRAHHAAAAITGPIEGLFSDWSTHRLLVYEGTCWLFLGEAARSVTVLTEATRHLSGDAANLNVLLAAQVDLAAAHADTGELHHACQLLADTYTQLRAIGNQRGIRRALAARRRMSRWDHEPAVRELDDRLRTR